MWLGALFLLILALVVICAILFCVQNRLYVGSGLHVEYKPYWIVSGDSGVDYSRLGELLETKGIIRYPDNDYVKGGVLQKVPGTIQWPHKIALVITHPDRSNAGRDYNSYSLTANVKNLADVAFIRAITNKAILHQNIPQFCAKTWPLNRFKWQPGIYIMRPVHYFAAGGKDIFVVTSAAEFEKACNFYSREAKNAAKSRNKNMQQYDVIVSEYITKPLLFHGKKCHLRLYGIATSTREFSVNRDDGEILTAKLPYKEGDWQNTEIHDTHAGSTDGYYQYPVYLPDGASLPRINEFLDRLELAIRPLIKIKPYPESDNAFLLFGIDVMIRDNGEPVLIEINERPGFEKPQKEVYSPRLCEWIWNHIEDLF